MITEQCCHLAAVVLSESNAVVRGNIEDDLTEDEVQEVRINQLLHRTKELDKQK